MGLLAKECFNSLAGAGRDAEREVVSTMRHAWHTLVVSTMPTNNRHCFVFTTMDEIVKQFHVHFQLKLQPLHQSQWRAAVHMWRSDLQKPVMIVKLLVKGPSFWFGCIFCSRPLPGFCGSMTGLGFFFGFFFSLNPNSPINPLYPSYATPFTLMNTSVGQPWRQCRGMLAYFWKMRVVVSYSQYERQWYGWSMKDVNI